MRSGPHPADPPPSARAADREPGLGPKPRAPRVELRTPCAWRRGLHHSSASSRKSGGSFPTSCIPSGSWALPRVCSRKTEGRPQAEPGAAVSWAWSPLGWALRPPTLHSRHAVRSCPARREERGHSGWPGRAEGASREGQDRARTAPGGTAVPDPGRAEAAGDRRCPGVTAHCAVRPGDGAEWSLQECPSLVSPEEMHMACEHMEMNLTAL